VWNLVAGKSNPPRQIDRGVGRDFANGQRESRLQQPFAVRGCEAPEERRCPRRPNDLERRGSRRRHPILERGDESREITVMIDVKMSQRDVGDRLPGFAKLREAPCDSTAAVEQQS
jgi:hypothetical protein